MNDIIHLVVEGLRDDFARGLGGHDAADRAVEVLTALVPEAQLYEAKKWLAEAVRNELAAAKEGS